jgi:heme/copper-type cytochrome/quinol oxidase subunit 2
VGAERSIDAEIEPGKTTEVTFTPQVTGRFTAICHHFCGAGHGNMHMVFVVE